MAESEQISAKTILVAETQPFLRSILVDILRNIGITKIHTASSCPEAITQVRTWFPDAIILDWHLKEGEGVKLANWVRKSPSCPNSEIPIIILTRDTSHQKILQARDCGIDEIIVKPVVPNAVVSRIKTIFSTKRIFVSSQSFVGPDRRRRAIGNYKGSKRRLQDTSDNPKITAQSKTLALCEELHLLLPEINVTKRSSVMKLYSSSEQLWQEAIDLENSDLEAIAQSLFNYIQATGISGRLQIDIVSRHLQEIENLRNLQKTGGNGAALLLEELTALVAKQLDKNRAA